MSAKEELLKLGINAWDDTRPKDDPDYMPIDYSFSDGEDVVAWLWGQSPSEIEWECNHPYQCIDFGDGEEQCECTLCGSFGDYHYEEDDEGDKVPEPHEWYPRRDVGGLIGEYLEELKNG